MSRTALVVIDIQDDYFAGGRFPLWQPDAALAQAERAIAGARARDWPVLLVQHTGTEASPFFRPDSDGVRLNPRLRAAAPAAPVIGKTRADSFRGTALADVLRAQGVDTLLLCGMMTQHCVTHTALSPAAAPFAVTVLGDACTSTGEVLHRIALGALADRVAVATVADALG